MSGRVTMREYSVKTVKIGDTIAIALPQELLATEQITDGMTLRITVQKCRGNPTPPVVYDENDPWRALE